MNVTYCKVVLHKWLPAKFYFEGYACDCLFKIPPSISIFHFLVVFYRIKYYYIVFDLSYLKIKPYSGGIKVWLQLYFL